MFYLQIVQNFHSFCRIKNAKPHPEWLDSFCHVKEKNIFKVIKENVWETLEQIQKGIGPIKEEDLKNLVGLPIMHLALKAITRSN